ncbi:MAG TPA: SDR family oxidoreductase [Chloroflexia bacterium]
MSAQQPEQSPRPVAIVTGASRRKGIGSAVCVELANAGMDILFTHWTPYDSSMEWGAEEDTPAALQSRLRSLGVRCEHLSINLAEADAPRIIMDTVEERLGTAAVLVNNAVHDTTDAPFSELDAPTLDAYYAVNIRGTMLLSVEFARRFVNGTGGRIINLTSGQGRDPMPGKLAYVATKGAIEAFTVTLSAEVAPLGITVNAVDPGPTDTGWMTGEIKEHLLPRFPMRRIGLPEDAARLIGFLASEKAGWVTGQIIRSTGGF